MITFIAGAIVGWAVRSAYAKLEGQLTRREAERKAARAAERARKAGL